MNDRLKRIQMLQAMGLGPLWASTAVGLHEPEPPLEEGIEGMTSADSAPDSGSLMVGTVSWSQTGTVARPASAEPAQLDVSGLDWSALQTHVAQCTNCLACHAQRRTVFGVGDSRPVWLFVGDVPSRQDEAEGQPFVGPAGRLLDNVMKALGASRTEGAYLANVLKCRPLDDGGRDRAPSPDEMAACLPLLVRQIELLQPRVIVALGKTAATALLGVAPEVSVQALRGRLHRWRDLPLIVTHHPTELLRKPADKAMVWRDLCVARSAL